MDFSRVDMDVLLKSLDGKPVDLCEKIDGLVAYCNRLKSQRDALKEALLKVVYDNNFSLVDSALAICNEDSK